jgi:flagellar motor component MotA
MDVINYVMIYTLLIILVGIVIYIIFELIKLKREKSLIDITELKDLNKEFKKHYKDIVVNGIMPPFVKQVNNIIEEENVNEYLTENRELMVGVGGFLLNAQLYPPNNNNTGEEITHNNTTEEIYYTNY